jgi:head-tail adaptor
MDPGRLDRRITIQKRKTTRGADGSITSGWSDFATVWAAKRELPAQRNAEVFGSSQHSDTALTEWTIRFLSGLDGSERIVDDLGVAGNVRGSPREVGRREFLAIVAERGIVK